MPEADVSSAQLREVRKALKLTVDAQVRSQLAQIAQLARTGKGPREICREIGVSSSMEGQVATCMQQLGFQVRKSHQFADLSRAREVLRQKNKGR